MSDAPSNASSNPWDLLISKWTALFAVLLLIGGTALQLWLPNHRLRSALRALQAAGCNVNPGVMPDGPAWLQDLIGYEAMKALTKPRFVFMYGMPQFGDEGMKCLSDLANLDGQIFDECYKLNLDNTQVSDDGLKHLAGMTSLTKLRLSNTQIKGEGLKHLAGLMQLPNLTLSHTQVGDEGLKHLAGLTNLGWLDLSHTQVSDEGLTHLTGMTHLTWLLLENTQVSDEGLKHLAGLTTLTYLHLHDTQVSDAGVERLRSALPGCRIETD